jgi:hypothetical protein
MTSEGHERKTRPKLLSENLKEKDCLENFGADRDSVKIEGFRDKVENLRT